MRKVVASELAFNGRLIKLYREKHLFPGGYLGALEVIKHPGAALIVPFISRDKLILIRQYRPVIDSYIWELPAGTLSHKEDILKCAKRELKEETGYLAKKMRRIGYIYPAPGYTTEKIIIFRADDLTKVTDSQEEDEVIEEKILSRAQVKKLFKAGKITDAKTICALTLAEVFR